MGTDKKIFLLQVPVNYMYNGSYYEYIEDSHLGLSIPYDDSIMDRVYIEILDRTYYGLDLKKDMTCKEVIDKYEKYRRNKKCF